MALDTSTRAVALGLAGTGAAGGTAWFLLIAAAPRWPGAGATVDIATGLAFLVSAAAGLVAAWAALLLAVATLGLLSDAVRRRTPRTRAGLAGRVAAGLLAAASLGAAPASAAALPPLTAATAPVSVADRGTVADGGTVAGGGTVADRGTVADGGTVADASRGADQETVVDLVPTPGWTPTATGTAAPPRATGDVALVSTSATTVTPLEEVVVHRGDTLWSIAERMLGEQATDEDVAEAWPRWYAANRDVIGDDPDRIVPGQVLVPPTGGGDR